MKARRRRQRPTYLPLNPKADDRGSLGLNLDKAGEKVADAVVKKTMTVFSTTMSEATQSVTGEVIQKGIDVIKPSSGSPYTPASTEPLEYHQLMKGELGECFSIIRGEVEKEVKEAEQKGALHHYGEWKRKQFLAIPIVADYPRTNDIPDVDKAALQAELGMWIAWANVRDIDYWNRAKKAVETASSFGMSMRDYQKGIEYIGGYMTLEPIRERLSVLGINSRVTIPFRTVISKQSLHIPMLAKLGKQLGGTFYNKLEDVVRSPLGARGELSKLISLPPIYKR